MSDLMLDVGQANELKLAFRRAHFTNEDIKRLCDPHLLGSVRSVLRGEAAINIISSVAHTIDCDADPFVPEGFSIEEHRQDGQFIFDPSQVELYLDDGQKGGSYIEGNKLRERLTDKPCLNATILDYLLKNPHLIPEEWEKDEQGNTRLIFFWGTVYRGRNDGLCVRYLYWAGWWARSVAWLDDDWNANNPALLRAC